MRAGKSDHAVLQKQASTHTDTYKITLNLPECTMSIISDVDQSMSNKLRCRSPLKWKARCGPPGLVAKSMRSRSFSDVDQSMSNKLRCRSPLKWKARCGPPGLVAKGMRSRSFSCCANGSWSDYEKSRLGERKTKRSPPLFLCMWYDGDRKSIELKLMTRSTNYASVVPPLYTRYTPDRLSATAHERDRVYPSEIQRGNRLHSCGWHCLISHDCAYFITEYLALEATTKARVPQRPRKVFVPCVPFPLTWSLCTSTLWRFIDWTAAHTVFPWIFPEFPYYIPYFLEKLPLNNSTSRSIPHSRHRHRKNNSLPRITPRGAHCVRRTRSLTK